MPQIHDPLKSLAGAKTRRRRNKLPPKANNVAKPIPAIGEDLLDFLEDDEKETKGKAGASRNTQVSKSVGDNTVGGNSKVAAAAATKDVIVVSKSESRENIEGISSENTPVAKSASTPSKQLHRAIAIDNRRINTEGGGRESDLFLYECRSFLQALDRRDLTPSTLAWTELHQPASKNKTVRPKQPVLRVCTESIVSGAGSCSALITSLTTSRPVSKEGTSQNPVLVPQHLTGYASWKLFCDFGKLLEPLNMPLMKTSRIFTPRLQSRLACAERWVGFKT
jgi:hypothetical protein